MTLRWTAAVLTSLVLLPGATQADFASEPRELTPPGPRMIFLPRARIRLGSTTAEVVAAAARCNRDAEAEACTPETFADELGGSEVVVGPFWLDRTEVSLGQYEHCVRQGRCAALPYEGGAGRFERPELPAVFVTYQEAHDYCVQRGARLPTEAELERAARGPKGRRYPWGDQFHGALANHGRWGISQTEPRDGFEELAPVEAYAEGGTPEGILQLAGNVAEWTSTLYGPYATAERPDPSAPRVVRGGHYLAAPAWLRGATRLHEPPHRRAPFLGFRCARSASAAAATCVDCREIENGRQVRTAALLGARRPPPFRGGQKAEGTT